MGGTFVAAGALAFLFFLWLGEGPDGGENATKSWRWFILRQKVTQAITVSSLVLRTVIGAQATLCTSLVAAVVLEQHGMPLSKVAQLSTLRSINDGPLQLTWLLLRSGPRSATLLKVLAIVLLVASVTIQFSSTILVTDLGNLSLVDDPVATAIPVGLTLSGAFANTPINALQRSPVPIPFGEIPSGIDATPTKVGYSDTGIVQRVFPPFTPRSITTVRLYSGNAFTVKSRFVCVPPSLSNLQAEVQ